MILLAACSQKGVDMDDQKQRTGASDEAGAWKPEVRDRVIAQRHEPEGEKGLRQPPVSKTPRSLWSKIKHSFDFGNDGSTG